MEAGSQHEPGEEQVRILSSWQPPHHHNVPMGQILVHIEQLKKLPTTARKGVSLSPLRQVVTLVQNLERVLQLMEENMMTHPLDVVLDALDDYIGPLGKILGDHRESMDSLLGVFCETMELMGVELAELD